VIIQYGFDKTYDYKLTIVRIKIIDKKFLSSITIGDNTIWL
jgi:hypothetical protein